MLQRLTTFIEAAGPAGLSQPEQRLFGAACLVTARMLMDADFGEFIVTGVHPVSGWTETGPMPQRFASQVLSVQCRVMGERKGALRLDSVGIPPWAAAKHLSMTSRVGHRPIHYLWYPAWRRSGRALGLVVRSLRPQGPALVYVGSR